MPPAHELTAPSPRVPALAVPRVAVRYRVALAVLALTALTFLIPSAPTYDPWAWIVWGREILHLDLSTVDGPSWKPLPVLLTTPFALFGGLAPGPVAVRRTGRRHRRRRHGLPGRAAPGRSAGRRRRRGRLRRRAVDAAQLGAGQLRGPARGAGAGRGRPPPRRAHPPRLPVRASAPRSCAPRPGPSSASTGCGCSGAIPGRAGSWPAAFVALPVLWLLPELWGSGDLLRAAHRAHNPRANSAAFSDDPIREVVRQFAAMLTPALWIGLGALVAMMALRLGSGRRERRAAHRAGAGRRGLGRRGRRDDQRRLQRQRPLPDHAGGGRLRAGRNGHRLADPGPARALVRRAGSPSRRVSVVAAVRLRRAERAAASMRSVRRSTTRRGSPTASRAPSRRPADPIA